MKTLFDKGLADIKKLGIRLVQHEDEFYWLFQKVYELQPKIYFQIGSFQGACEIVLSRACADNAIIVSIDNGTEGRKGEPRIEAVHASSEFLNQKGYRSFVIEGESENPRVINQAYGILHDGDKPDFVYIDGGHSKYLASSDVVNYRCKQGGIVAMHDINPNANKEIEVHKVWKLVNEKNERIFWDTKKIKTEQCILHDKNGGVGLIYY